MEPLRSCIWWLWPVWGVVLGFACSNPGAPILQVNFVLPESPAFVGDIDAYKSRVYYAGGDKTGILIEEAFAAGEGAPAILDGLQPTAEGESITVSVEGFGEGLILARATSGPLQLSETVPGEIKLFLGAVEAFNVLSAGLADSRTGHTSISLTDGRVFLAGGADGEGTILDTTIVFDDGYTSTVFGDSAPAGPLQVPRIHHTSSLLTGSSRSSQTADGRVMVAGGENGDRLRFVPAANGVYVPSLLNDGENDVTIEMAASVDLFDPVTGEIEPGNPLQGPRSFHQAVAIEGGGVLMCGGIVTAPSDGSSPTEVEVSQSCEKWGVEPGSSSGFSVHSRRVFHQMTLLDGGKVLITGGVSELEVDPDYLVMEAEWFDPATPDPEVVGRLTGPRAAHAAVIIPDSDGKVLLAGGYSRVTYGATYLLELSEYADIFDPAEVGDKPFSRGARMKCPRAFHSAIPVGGGKVLIVGGIGQTPFSRPGPEIYDDATGEFELVEYGDLDCGVEDNSQGAESVTSAEARYAFGSSPLNNGSYLFSGGEWRWGSTSVTEADRFVIYVPR